MDASAVIERYRYGVFGAPTIYAPNWTVRSATIYNNRFLFTGREYAATYRSTYNVPAFNFYEYRARAYNPTLGRFMSEDPKGFDAGEYNLYRYCHNDPEDLTDPMGLGPDAVRPGIIIPPPPSPAQQRPPNPFSGSSPTGYSIDKWASGALRGAVEAKFYVREGQLTLLDRSRGEALAVRMESGKGAVSNVPEAEALALQGLLPRGAYRILSRTQDGSQLYKHTGFNGYILAPIDSTPFNDRYDAFRRGAFRMHYGAGVGCLTTCVPSDFARVQSFLGRSSTVLQRSVTGWGIERFYGILNVNTTIHD